ncbi:MAG: methylmalonyl-CoA mutase [Planctomycetes bacterium]|nr:methylmalonyl-CoA mutase [Planctomycetota bacterium]
MDTPEVPRVFLESGIEVKPLYTADDATGHDPGRPGEFPFTRGIHPLMYRRQPWTMRQYAGFGTPAQTNERFRSLLSHGQNALNIAFDLPTQLGLDSDDPRAEGEVGRVGMAVDTLDDLERALDGIPLDRVSTAMTINAPALVLMSMLFAVAEKQQVPIGQVRGTIQNDILKEFVGRGAWIFPVGPSVRLVADAIEFCGRSAPKFNAVSVCGYHLRESGANPAQEMGLAFEIARAYLDAALARGLAIDDVAPRVTFNFNVYGNLWEQVAKFRAGRRRWAAIVRDEYRARDAKSMHLRMIAGGGGSGLTIEEPENNIVRGACYALAAALGGAQTMALCCYDEAYTIPSEKASLLALRTMQILAEEMGLCDTVDPLGGSYYIESLTGAMEERIVASMAEVRALGGIVNAIEQGTIQRRLAGQAYEIERRLRSGQMPKVGVNRHAAGGATPPSVEVHPYDAAAAKAKSAGLRDLRATRSAAAAERTLAAVGRAAEGSENLVPPILDAVKARATLGEITAALKEVFGEFREPAF